MILQEVLRLEKVQSSIKKIDLFLVSQVKYSDEYLQALCYKASILHAIGKTNEALKILFSIVAVFADLSVNGIIYTCDAIIDICLDLKRFDQVSKYIKIKENYLPISKSVLHIKDNIKLYLATKSYDDAKNELLKYLADDISKEESIFAKEQLLNIYFLKHNYNEFLNLAEDLESYYQSNLSLDKLKELNLNKIKVYFDQGNYLKVIHDGNIFLKDGNLDSDTIISCATILINSYLIINDYKRASIIESDYCELLNDCNLDLAINFSKQALDLYTKTNTLVSVTEYQNKIKELELKKKETKTNTKRKKKEEIVIPTIEVKEEPIEESNLILTTTVETKNIDPHQEVKPQIKDFKNVIVSSNFEKLRDVFDTINQLDLKTKFREIYRSCCIKLEQLYNIEEAYILYFKRQYLGIHYKKERAYDKKLEYEQIEKTLLFEAMNYEQEIFMDKEQSAEYKNIVTNDAYCETYGFSLPLVDNFKPIGAIAFFSKEEFLDNDLSYESLKLITSLLNTRLLQSLKQDEIEYNNKKLFFINENMSSGIKEEVDGYIHLSSRCSEILGVLEDMTQEDYLSKMKPEDIMEYKNIHERLYTMLSMGLSLEYDFKKDGKYIRIKEQYYPMVYEGSVYILSIIDDVTGIYNDKKELIDLAYKNPISKLDTEVKLMVDLNSYYKFRKLSLAVADVIDFNLYKELYGYNFSKQLIYAIGKNLVDYFQNDFNTFIYHLERDQFVVLFLDINDKRIVDSKLRAAFEFITNKLFELNFRVKLKFNIGVYRLQKHISIDDPAKILYYALDALDALKDLRLAVTSISHYDSEVNKKRFNKNQLITHISESIDHSKLGLTYKQIINLDKNEVFGYMVLLNLDNYEVDSTYLDFVVERRGLRVDLEKYLISNTFKEIKMLKDASRGYVLSFIDVCKETLEDNFYSFIQSQKVFYKIANNYIAFCVNDAQSPIIKKLKSEGYLIASYNVLDVYNNNCDYFLFDFHNCAIMAIKEIEKLCQDHNITLIFINIDSLEDLNFCKENNFNYIYGNYYKKAIRMKSIIEKINN